MMYNPISPFRCAAWIRVLGLFVSYILSQSSSSAQSFVFNGVSEGETVSLPVGVATTNLGVSVTPTVSIGSTNVIFSLEYQGALLLSRTTAPPHSVTFSNLAAGKYFLTAQLDAPGSIVAGDISFDIAPVLLRPPNDHWASAEIIPTFGTIVFATNHQATIEPDEPMHTGAAAGRSVWWKWTAPLSGNVTATTRGSVPDTVLSVYTGTNLATLLMVAANNDAGFGTNVFSQVSFNAVEGKEYFFAVDSAVTGLGVAQTGPVRLQLLNSLPPTISMAAPPDGESILVPIETSRTNLTLSATINDPGGITQVSYLLDGNGTSDSGLLPPPYVLNRTNLAAGDYWLSLMAVNNSGLVSVAHVGFSVNPVGAKLLFADIPAYTTNGFRFALTGRRGATYQLQSSSNLDVWCSVTGYTNFPGVVKVAESNAPVGSVFYRAVTQ